MKTDECSVSNCTRHELWGALCYDHLAAALSVPSEGRKVSKKAAQKVLDQQDTAAVADEAVDNTEKD